MAGCQTFSLAPKLSLEDTVKLTQTPPNNLHQTREVEIDAFFNGTFKEKKLKKPGNFPRGGYRLTYENLVAAFQNNLNKRLSERINDDLSFNPVREYYSQVQENREFPRVHFRGDYSSHLDYIFASDIQNEFKNLGTRAATETGFNTKTGI